MSVRPHRDEPTPTILQAALRRCRQQFVGVGLFSLAVNLLTLTTALYMMQLFDRVLASRSLDTLLYLSLVAALAVGFQGALEAARTLVLSRTSAWIEHVVGPEVFERGLEARLRGGRYGMEGLRDLATCRGFLSSPAMMSLYDLPWVPIYLAVAFLFHPIIGWIAAGGVAVLFTLTLLTNRLSGAHLKRANSDAMHLNRHTEAVSRNAEVIDSMGMVPAIKRHWQAQVALMAADQQRAADITGILLAISKFMRVLIQIACLGAGAYLALQNEITGGAMVAASIIMGRALAPVEQVIGTWKQFTAARQGYRRLTLHLGLARLRPAGIPLPEPDGRLAIDRVTYAFAGSRVSMIKGITFTLEPGESLAVLGPSAAGKTTLARLLVGAMEPSVGAVRLDGANVFAWPHEDLGRHLGYLPQDVELFDGTVLANIARFDDAEPAEVIAAAQLAGCHDMILRLPNGYETEIGEGGAMLSGGQRQLVGLARALFRNPRLVVLDEPNANMDTEGEMALMHALENLKARQATVIMITHRPSLVQSVDKVLVMRDGTAESFGPRDEVMKRLIQPVARPASAPVPSRVALAAHRAGQGAS
ncbi:type I secretion system permease/ATPase [Reyranella sp. CPCC 100927]|uniref:type I secretion system permease/ATPase n=1 Tax=Reyranella sp. CPCC 100927 TaxID=2599616 RepID=UPI0011B5A613|nr:type I secretion system permease/ATPase [Reyranella sp. CPCC 100927]TWT13898.1 type I secretion system permease/ATPase [Reyranella sp. CPCC 100927]